MGKRILKNKSAVTEPDVFATRLQFCLLNGLFDLVDQSCRVVRCVQRKVGEVDVALELRPALEGLHEAFSDTLDALSIKVGANIHWDCLPEDEDRFKVISTGRWKSRLEIENWLDVAKEILEITASELFPVHDFYGSTNWTFYGASEQKWDSSRWAQLKCRLAACLVGVPSDSVPVSDSIYREAFKMRLIYRDLDLSSKPSPELSWLESRRQSRRDSRGLCGVTDHGVTLWEIDELKLGIDIFYREACILSVFDSELLTADAVRAKLAKKELMEPDNEVFVVMGKRGILQKSTSPRGYRLVPPWNTINRELLLKNCEHFKWLRRNAK